VVSGAMRSRCGPGAGEFHSSTRGRASLGQARTALLAEVDDRRNGPLRQGPTNGRHGLLRLVAVLAFTAWGTAQVAPDPSAAGALNDAAILLFVIDGGCAVMAEARAILAKHKQAAQATPL
jgi:hypothetical protein